MHVYVRGPNTNLKSCVRFEISRLFGKDSRFQRKISNIYQIQGTRISVSIWYLKIAKFSVKVSVI